MLGQLVQRSPEPGSCRHGAALVLQAPPWGQGQAKARLGHRPTGGPGRAGLWGEGSWACCGLPGAGAGGPGADVGAWAGAVSFPSCILRFLPSIFILFQQLLTSVGLLLVLRVFSQTQQNPVLAKEDKTSS